jgi:predicted dehydrogenase
MDRLRVGVVGVGYLGRFHALIYARLPGVELVGVADTRAEVAQQVATEAGCAAYADGRDLLGKVDAVSVVVPTTAHLAVARPFLEHGTHVLLEKPIATTAEEGRAIVQLARRSGAVLQIGHLERYNGGVMALAARISQPRFIEAHRMSGFVARATDVDVISDLMIHDIDIILALVGSTSSASPRSARPCSRTTSTSPTPGWSSPTAQSPTSSPVASRGTRAGASASSRSAATCRSTSSSSTSTWSTRASSRARNGRRS